MKNGAAAALAAAICLCLLGFTASLSLAGTEEEDPASDGPDGKESPPEPKEESKDKDKAKPKVKLTVDELYVREHLEEHLHATDAEYFDNGYVKLTFDFLKKDLDQGKSFTPPVSQVINSPFRWTVTGEEKTATFKDGSTLRTRGGLKIASTGSAFLNCWYQDDVTVTLDYLPFSNYDPRQMVALLFQNDKKKALGTNYGNQCAIYVNGRPKGEVRGKVPPIASLEGLIIKLIVKGGKFDAQVGKTPKESMDYNPKEFTSGRVGLVWGGPNVNGIVKKLEIAGRLDFPRVAKEIRAAPRK